MGWDKADPHRLGRLPGLFAWGLRKITEEGVKFASPVDGAKLFPDARESMRIQRALNSDIVMIFDEMHALPGDGAD